MTKRVLMVVSVLARGGCERQLLATATGLVRRGYVIEVFTLADVSASEPNFKAEFVALGIPISCAAGLADTDAAPLDVYGLAPYEAILKHLSVTRLGQALARVIARFQPNVVHCWSELSCLIGGRVAISLGIQRILLQLVSVPPDERDLPEAQLYRQGFRDLVAHPNVLMLNISERNGRSFERWMDVPAGTIRLLRNGLQPGTVSVRSRYASRRCRRQLGLPVRALVVGAIMRFADEKDPDLWLDTAARVAAARPQTYFVLAGYGPFAERIALRVAALGLADRFVLPGPVVDIGAVHAALDVFLMTSHFEGTPNALVEAQAAGVPVVAPAVGGIAETIADGITGSVVPTRSAESLAAALIHILDEAGFRRRAAVEGPRFVAERFNWRKKIDQTIAYYARTPHSAAVGPAARLGQLWAHWRYGFGFFSGRVTRGDRYAFGPAGSAVHTASCGVPGSTAGVNAAIDEGGSGN